MPASTLPHASRPIQRPARQTTLKSAINCQGIGLHSGARVSMVLRPAPIHTGILFRRHLPDGTTADIPAHWTNVAESPLCTALTDGDGNSVLTIEHLMAAFAGCGVDNCVVELDGPEVPSMDGSADRFVFLIDCAGIVDQDAERRVIRVRRTVRVSQGQSWASIEPAPALSVGFEIDFPNPAIGRQSLSLLPTPERFRKEIAPARTFGFLAEVDQLRAAGKALGASLDNALVIDGDRVLNEGGLRFADEFVRHKMLDAIGDLALAGGVLVGRFTGHRSSHALTRRLLAALFADASAWTDRAPRGVAEPLARAPEWAEPALALA